mmetsp:Transcript_28262/g.47513  ORF Transcript_28262/g.47513 Transcript_28262/m.47513 type:complete len:524 (-) Transcript_28262:227-1798(-)
MEYTAEEVAQHNTEADCWIILGSDQKKVYDVSEYLHEHPGGARIIIDLAGKDAEDDFDLIMHSDEAISMLDKYLIGVLVTSRSNAAVVSTAVSPAAGISGSTTPIIKPPIELFKFAKWGEFDSLFRLLNQTCDDAIEGGSDSQVGQKIVDVNTLLPMEESELCGSTAYISDHGDHTALDWASFYGHCNVMKLLLQHGAIIEHALITGTSAATTSNSVLCTNTAVDCGGALHCACMTGQLLAVRLLLDSGARIDALNSAGLTALQVTLTYAHPKFLSNLEAKGYPVINTRSHAASSAVGKSSPAALLHPACNVRGSPRDEAAAALASVLDNTVASAEAEASFEKKDTVNSGQSSGSDTFTGGDHVQVALLLIERSSGGQSCFNTVKSSPLHLASMYGHADIVDALLKQGAYNKDAQDVSFKLRTPLHHAAAMCQIDVVEMLLHSGANMQIRDEDGLTAEQVIGSQSRALSATDQLLYHVADIKAVKEVFLLSKMMTQSVSVPLPSTPSVPAIPNGGPRATPPVL